MKMNESLFDDIIDTAQDCIFWKDKNRRFVGANQSFLDFYGFESTDVLIGKTDEDMGWHNDPEPFKQDELRVLAGEITYKVLGKCMVRGEERDIIATKRPIYRGDEIVGLVGSFSDVTEVMRRKSDRDQAQVMYTIEQLREYPYFDRLLDEVSLTEVLDSLTGIISRAYMYEFAKSLISSRTPFTFTILDLDNFKDINDSFGHHAGDIVLMDVARELALYTRGYGVVGRFGGDELLFINLRDIRYDDKMRFFKRLYNSGKILRKKIRADGHSVYITGTAGCATYPTDSVDYDELFADLDKTLYQGKNQGRNCFTIYKEKEHGDIDVKSLSRTDTYSYMNRIAHICEKSENAYECLDSVLPMLDEELQISTIYFVDDKYTLHTSDNRVVAEDVSDICELVEEDIYSSSTLNKAEEKCPVLYEALKEQGIRAILIIRIGDGTHTDGYMICAESRNNRIWQDSEISIMYFLGREIVHLERA